MFSVRRSSVRTDACNFRRRLWQSYRIASEGKIYLFTGSRSTGGFCVTRLGLFLPSKLGHILTKTPALLHYEPPLAPFSAIRAGPIAGRTSPEPVRSDWPRTRWSSCIWNPVCSYSPPAAAILPLPWAQRGRCWTERRNSQARFHCTDRAPVVLLRESSGLFSIHIPRKGMTDVALLPALEHVISIHVPMKGTTVEAAVGLALNEFQSSCPVRGTTLSASSSRASRSKFQSSCPVRGTTWPSPPCPARQRNFNPRAP